VIVRHWDTGGRQREPIVGGYAEDESGQEVAVDEETAREISVPVESIEQAELAAKAAFERTRQTRVTGRGELIGLPTLRVGHVVRLGGLSDQVNASYYVTSVTHRVDESGYATTIGVRLADGETIEIEPS
jgi:phage protein D